MLLLCPDAYGQITASVKKYTISGSIGVPGVTMQGLPDMPQTNENGVYSAQVPYGWNGTVTPVKNGYTFVPTGKTYEKVKENQTQDYQPKMITYTISGSAGKPDVTMTGFPNDPVTGKPVVSNAAGVYIAVVDYGFSGTVTPEKPGFRFEPSSRPYNQVTQNKTNENYQAFDLKFVIAGTVGKEGVTMQGLPNNPKSLAGGTYRAEVPFGWHATVTPVKEGHTFSPEKREYEPVIQDHPNDTYTASVQSFRIPITTGMSGVTLEGLPGGDAITDESGSHVAVVEYGFTGKITPRKPGYNFDPPSKSYTRVTADTETLVFRPLPIQLTISGNAGTSGVVLSGLPGNPMSDNTGAYMAKVDWEWSGIVTPQKDGYIFEPGEKPYNAVIQDQPGQTYKATRITYPISGNVNLPNVVLEGLPVRVVSDQNGSYTVNVDYRWSGKVTPKLQGYTFDPPERPYEPVLMAMPGQDYTARIVQHTVSGRVASEGKGLDGVLITGDNDAGSTTTDANGEFQLLVNNGWRGQLTPQKEGYTFAPQVVSQPPVVKDVPNVAFIASIRMMSITESIVLGEEPIEGVLITAQPGGYTALTDAKGKCTIRVPYDWTGELFPTKEGFEFNPPSIPYANVTADIDKTASAPPVSPPPSTQGPAYTPPPRQDVPPVVPDGGARPQVDTTPAPAPVDTIPPAGAGLTAKDVWLQRLSSIQQEMNALPLGPESLQQMEKLTQNYNQVLQMLGTMGVSPADLVMGGPNQVTPGPTTPEQGQGPIVSAPIGMDLIDVLTKLSEQTGVEIAVDATVKPEPVQVSTTSLTGLSVPAALQKVLTGTKYTYESVNGAYLVFHPVSNMYTGGVDILQALQDITAETGVPLQPDPNVAGMTYATFTNQPLEKALDMLLAGSQFVYQRFPTHYVVADRSPDGVAFPAISQTRQVWVNHRTPTQVKAMLSPVYGLYVQAEAANPTDPNDQGHILTVTADARLAEKIVGLIKDLDVARPQVLLDARVVVMERGNMVNLGVEWQFPSLQYGRFYNGDDWLKAISIGYSADGTFTNALMATLNLLEATNQADIVAHPQLISQDGRQAQLRSIQEEWFMMGEQQNVTSAFGYYSRAELTKIESGTILTITPHVGDNNEITLDMAVEVSDSIPRGPDSDLPIVTRRQAKNSVTVKDGGTVAVAGLTENRGRQVDKRVPVLGSIPLVGELFKNKDHSKSTREVAVFVTANLVRDRPLAAGGPVASGPAPLPDMLGVGSRPQQAGPEFEDGLKRALQSR